MYHRGKHGDFKTAVRRFIQREYGKSRFPALTELAQQRVAQIQKLDDLQQLNVQLSTARNQTAARRILKNGFVD
jgi:hypothetical protein